MTTQILIPLHRARSLQPGDEFVRDGMLYRLESVSSGSMKRAEYKASFFAEPTEITILATVTPLPAPKLTLPEKP